MALTYSWSAGLYRQSIALVQRVSNPWISSLEKDFAKAKLSSSGSLVAPRRGVEGVYWWLPIGRKSSEWREMRVSSVCSACPSGRGLFTSADLVFLARSAWAFATAFSVRTTFSGALSFLFFDALGFEGSCKKTSQSDLKRTRDVLNPSFDNDKETKEQTK